jgi:acyl carrier protein
MIKIRGFRVEPSEVENALRKHPAVDQAVVVGWSKPKPENEIALVAYVVSKTGAEDLPAQLRKFLGSHLPSYMVPAHYIFLDQLPLNANGKVDRKGLAEPDWAAVSAGSPYVAPQTEDEKYLTQVWQTVLGKEKVGIHDDFFLLGGHSLAAFRMMSRIEEDRGVKVPLQILVQYPTIAALAPVFQNIQSDLKQMSVVELRGGTLPALFVISGGARSALSSTRFARLIQPQCRVYGLEYPGMEGYLEPLDRIESLAAYFIEQIRSVQPHGPYYLGGFCLGGVIAFEIACQLKGQGEEIGPVALLDSSPPGMKDNELDNQGNWYYFDRMRTLFGAENRRNAVPFIKSRLGRLKLFGKRIRPSGMYARERRRIKQPGWIKNQLDEQSLFVIDGLRKARKNYRPKPLDGQGLAILSGMAKGTPREAWWSRLFTEFNCHYIPNTTHSNIFSDASLAQLTRLVSLSIQQHQESERT